MSIYVFGVGLVLSQFYVFKSGVPQPAHFLLVLPILFYFFRHRRFVINPFGDAAPILLIIFFVYTAMVNFSYMIAHQETDFILPIIYLSYGLCVYFVLQNILIYRKDAVRSMSIFLLIGLLLLFSMAMLGLGQFRFFPRYNAFFNDPNQMAFWALCVSSMLLVQKSLSDVVKGIIFLFLFYIILKSASRSGLMGFSILFLGFLMAYFKVAISSFDVKKIGIVFVSFFVVGVLAYYVLADNLETILFLENRVNQVDVGSQADKRGYTRLIEYPEYIFLGAGQGAELRFNERGTEIHSTWAGLLFYYGIPGALLILHFVYLIAKKLSFSQKMIFAAPLMYSFSTFGFRTPIFWVFLAFFYSFTLLQKSRKQPYSLSESAVTVKLNSREKRFLLKRGKA